MPLSSEVVSLQDRLRLREEELESLRLVLKEKSDLLAASQADQTLLTRQEELSEDLEMKQLEAEKVKPEARLEETEQGGGVEKVNGKMIKVSMAMIKVIIIIP